jgi:hypothetical protein
MVYLRNAAIACRGEEDGNFIALNQITGAGYLMNATSKAIFDCCDGRDTPAIVSYIQGQYGGSVPNNLQDIVEKHLSLLEKAEILEVCESVSLTKI